MLDRIRNIKLGRVAFAVLLAILGLSFLIFCSSSVALTVIIGIFIALLGAVMLALDIIDPQRDRVFIMKIVISSLFIACGTVIAILNDKVFPFILFAVCIVVATDSAFRLKLSLSCKKHDVGGWWIIAIPSFLILLSAFLLTGFTPKSETAASVWLGITLLALAALDIISTIWSSKCKTAQKAEIYYEVYRDLKDSEKN